MKKITLLSLALISILTLSACANKNDEIKDANNDTENNNTEIASAYSADNASYIIEGVSYKLDDGSVEVSEIPDSASKTIVKLFTSSSEGDMNNDSSPDTAVILTKEAGGSGTFYYVSLAVKNGETYTGTNSFLLGDRIAPQNISISNGKITVNYAMRYPGDSFDVAPSLGISRNFILENGELLERTGE